MYDQCSSEIKFSELQEPEETWLLIDLIGEGTYGEVYSAKNKHTGTVIHHFNSSPCVTSFLFNNN